MCVCVCVRMWLRTRARLIGFIFNLTWPWSDFYVSLLCVCVPPPPSVHPSPVCVHVLKVCTSVCVWLCARLSQWEKLPCVKRDSLQADSPRREMFQGKYYKGVKLHTFKWSAELSLSCLSLSVSLSVVFIALLSNFASARLALSAPRPFPCLKLWMNATSSTSSSFLSLLVMIWYTLWLLTSEMKNLTNRLTVVLQSNVTTKISKGEF